MGAPYTLQQLLTPLAEPQVRARFLAYLQAGGLPAISEWSANPAGLEMTAVQLVSRAIDDLLQSGAPAQRGLDDIAAAGHLRYAKGDWLTVLALGYYLLARAPATKTTFTMKLSSVSTAPPYSFQPGDVVLVAPSGNHYVSTGQGDLSPGGSLQMAFEAEAEGSSFSDDPSVVQFTLGTAFAGVSVAPGGGLFTPVAHSGPSTGTLTPFADPPGVPTLPHTFAIRIDGSGSIGSAAWSMRVDSGPYVAMGIFAGSAVDLVDGTAIATRNGAATPSFIAGDVFQFSTPGTPGYIQGDDEETDAAIVARCLARWQGLTSNVLSATAALWTAIAYPAANRIAVTADTPDGGVPGRFLVSVADSHGGIDQAVANTIAAFIRPRLDLATGEDVLVQSASTFPVVVTAGNVKVPAQQLAAVQQAAQLAWVAYLAGVPIGGVVRIAKLEEIIMDAGAVDVGDVTPLALNGVAGVNVQMVAGQVPVDANAAALAGALNWMPL